MVPSPDDPTRSHQESTSDYLDDMYMSEQGSDDENMQTLSSAASFRSAASDIDMDEFDARKNASSSTSLDLTGADEPTKSSPHNTAVHMQPSNIPKSTTQTHTTAVHTNPDLMAEIKGMYRILDLLSEQGSGGLVDKIIISQESLGQFVNKVSPGAYTSMTKIDFSALDGVLVNPQGVYGSRSEIVRFLQDIGAVDTRVAALLHHCKDDASTNGGRTLRSGLYLLRMASQPLVYVIYWPEETTWNDNASLSVQKNRVTFMRYLTKIADQLVALVSGAHGAAMEWNDQAQDVHMDTEDDEIDRLFSFQVEKTNEQEEQATVRPGFKLDLSKATWRTEIPSECPVNPDDLLPWLVPGETICGIAQARVIQPHLKRERVNEKFTRHAVQRILESDSFRLSKSLSDSALLDLLQLGLGRERAPDAVADFKASREAATKAYNETIQTNKASLKTWLSEQNDLLVGALQGVIADAVVTKFSTLSREQLIEHTPTEEEKQLQHEHLQSLLKMYPAIEPKIREASSPHSIKINLKAFKDHKKRMLLFEQGLHEQPDLGISGQQQLLRSSLQDPIPTERHGIVTSVWSYIPFGGSHSPSKGTRAVTYDPSDTDFLAGLPAIADKYPFAAEAVEECFKLAQDYLASQTIKTKAHELAASAQRIQSTACERQIKQEADAQLEAQMRISRETFLQDVGNMFINDSKHIVIIDDLRVGGHYNPSYTMTGFHEIQAEAKLQYTVHVMRLTESDRHQIQIESTFIPLPKILPQASFRFSLPLNHRITHLQLLQDERCLVVTDNQSGSVKIFLERFQDIERAIELDRSKKNLHREKIGREFLLAFDETKRMLAVCGTQKPFLHVFIFDEKYTALQGLGTPVDLRAWYDVQVQLTHIAFLCGNGEELVLVDNGGYARIYSLTTQQFRPASLQLPRQPLRIHSSPDGSCLLSAEHDNGGLYLRAYHWSNFGASSGICLELPGFPPDSCIMTSMGSRSQMHYVGLDVNSYHCESFALDITRRVTEFMFKEKGGHAPRNTGTRTSAHNCLIDSFADVWTRFPVIPAVQRNTVKAAHERRPPSILFVCSLSASALRSHFRELVAQFERTTRKPTENKLGQIAVDAVPYGQFLTRTSELSTFKAGEWLVDILCLIPIHIAVTRDNRFVPLKDGVLSAELERSLLGATVGQIVDSLTFGWYESIFQSYLALKPVRVVSSMGEQSVGKSFALNHLVDTSFAGSAMRTTEGVWMSVTPTDDALIVALDFEGVHSIERSAQEDTLLVLFNTALSNLVLFRNNFAMSRDIAGLFQSFQSSSTVLDPAANPTLFKSTLVIIIKDVVDSDKNEITKEFRLKFQKIVEVEQGSNFISRLHGGKLTIIPWPVIESRQFYTLFPALKKVLDKQEITHQKAGIFLQTMKTLMAKLKANDWGALDQNLASHRAQQLLALLPHALGTGVAELHPEIEPLKDFDSGVPIDLPDTDVRFYLSESDDAQKVPQGPREEHLQTLLESSTHYAHRFDGLESEWMQSLGDHLENLASLRVDHVREWLDANTARFNPDFPQLQEVHRVFDSLIVALKANIKLCGLQCSSCQLSCLSVRHHNGAHNCHTSHRCPHHCDYIEDHAESGIQTCGLPAGHTKGHICAISAHLCGKPCDLYGKGGCMQYCSKMVNHEDELHMCPATLHQCGEPCSLRDVRLRNGTMYNCQGHCQIPIHEPHEEHTCEKQSCPIQCRLCKRLCASSQHLHALAQDGTAHLCGQDHPCNALCQLPGICQIETAPQSVEATFTGRHQTFQYTKYSQASKRLQCVVRIPSGELAHAGQHIHSTEKNVFHFCETRCDNCGYFCTLPLGHMQQEHETSHGSMSKTTWAIDGPDGTVVEVNGRKFGSRDDGAPMLCSMYCRDMGRHIHIDYCRSQDPQTCSGADLQHTNTRMVPEPLRPKDYVSHALHWRRTGFKDPYSQDDQNTFAKCDSMCSGQEHQVDATGVAHPSYCTLGIFHQPLPSNQPPPGGIGYVSRDGHHFGCRNPAQMQQAFHVMFVIDRSGSMGGGDRKPLASTPVTNRLTANHNNRLGAVYSSLYAFWAARAANMGAGAGATNRRDAYSVILFDHTVATCVDNDFASTPDQLLGRVLAYGAGGGTNYTSALNTAQAVMERNWSTERSPVIIFLSDGECSVADETVRDFCRRAVALGRALSFHSVAFGPRNQVLRRMAEIANEVESRAPNDPMHPLIPSSYTEALDTIRLAETFLGLADSLKKPRGSLIHG